MNTWVITIVNDWTNDSKTFVTTSNIDGIGAKSEAIAEKLTSETGDRHWVRECVIAETI
jgi:hypothetical protein